MKHKSFDRNKNATVSSDRSFGFVFFLVFILIAFAPMISAGEIRGWALIAGGVFLLAAIVRPSLLSSLNRVWTKFGLLMHQGSSPIVLAILFFLIMSPYAIVMRLFHRDILNLSYQPESESYWVNRKTTNDVGQNMKNQF